MTKMTSFGNNSSAVVDEVKRIADYEVQVTITGEGVQEILAFSHYSGRLHVIFENRATNLLDISVTPDGLVSLPLTLNRNKGLLKGVPIFGDEHLFFFFPGRNQNDHSGFFVGWDNQSGYRFKVGDVDISANYDIYDNKLKLVVRQGSKEIVC